MVDIQVKSRIESFIDRNIPCAHNDNCECEKNSRIRDLTYNFNDSQLNIHFYGCSWTYGNAVEQKQSFPHIVGKLLNSKINTSIYNYGLGGAGIEYMVHKLLQTNIGKSDFIVMCVPSISRRRLFDHDGHAYTSQRHDFNRFTDYDNYYNFCFNYKLVNTLYPNKVLWTTWGKHKDGATSLVPDDKVQFRFDCIDYGTDNLHPGVKSHLKFGQQIYNWLSGNLRNN